MKKLLILMFAAVLASGCTQKGDLDNSVIAKINDTKITKEDFLREISRVPEWARDRFKGKEGKEQFLDELIKKELIYLDAKKKGLDKDKEFIAKVEEFKKMTLLAAVLKKEIEEKTEVAEKDIKDFYDKNPDEFKKGAAVRARHILVDTEAEANDIVAKIKKGEDFSELAKSLSKDKDSAQKGGDLGFFSQGRMVPEFEKAAFSLKPDEVSNPVKTQFGYHIIKVIDKKEGAVVDFEQAKNVIKRRLLSEKQKSLFDSYIEGLKKNTKPVKNEEALAAISLPWEQQAEEEKPHPDEQVETE